MKVWKERCSVFVWCQNAERLILRLARLVYSIMLLCCLSCVFDIPASEMKANLMDLLKHSSLFTRQASEGYFATQFSLVTNETVAYGEIQQVNRRGIRRICQICNRDTKCVLCEGPLLTLSEWIKRDSKRQEHRTLKALLGSWEQNWQVVFDLHIRRRKHINSCVIGMDMLAYGWFGSIHRELFLIDFELLLLDFPVPSLNRFCSIQSAAGLLREWVLFSLCHSYFPGWIPVVSILQMAKQQDDKDSFSLKHNW